MLLRRNKSSVPPEEQKNLIYKIPRLRRFLHWPNQQTPGATTAKIFTLAKPADPWCHDCEDFYIGQTSRPLVPRLRRFLHWPNQQTPGATTAKIFTLAKPADPWCHDCEDFYIGQTSRPLVKRIKEHEAGMLPSQQLYGFINR